MPWCMCGRQRTTYKEPVLSFYQVWPGDQTHAIRFGVKCLNPLDHLIKLTKKRLTWSLLQPCYKFGKRDCISLYF